MSAIVVTTTLILLAGVADDFRSRKFHNWLFVASCVVAIAVVFATQGLWGLGLSVAGFIAGIVVFLPLVQMNIVGAGDMKLMAAVGIIAGWNSVAYVALYSLFWGAAFGVVQVVLKGELPQLVRNLGSMTVNRGQAPAELHRIPYTAALLVGWFTHLYLAGGA